MAHQTKSDDRCQDLAAVVSKRFGIEGSTVVRPSGAHDLNRLYVVVTPSGQFTLRVYEVERDFDHIRSEIWLLNQLQQSGFSVPQPVLDIDESYVSQTSLDTDTHYCVLCNWIEGEPVSRQAISERSAEQIRQIGRELSRFHSFTEQIEPPSWFSAPRRDVDELKEIIEEMRSSHAPLKILQSLRDTLSILEGIGCASEGFGLIHNDLNAGNLLIREQGVSFLDFTHFGWGFHLCDLAKLVDAGVGKSNTKELLEGYAELRRLPDTVEVKMDVLRRARRNLRRYGWNWF